MPDGGNESLYMFRYLCVAILYLDFQKSMPKAKKVIDLHMDIKMLKAKSLFSGVSCSAAVRLVSHLARKKMQPPHLRRARAGIQQLRQLNDDPQLVA